MVVKSYNWQQEIKKWHGVCTNFLQIAVLNKVVFALFIKIPDRWVYAGQIENNEDPPEYILKSKGIWRTMVVLYSAVETESKNMLQARKNTPKYGLGPVNTCPFSFENATLSLRIRLPSTRIRWKRSPKTQLFDQFWKRSPEWNFLKTPFSCNLPSLIIINVTSLTAEIWINIHCTCIKAEIDKKSWQEAN